MTQYGKYVYFHLEVCKVCWEMYPDKIEKSNKKISRIIYV